ncbi:PadR family transcriptional regulator [Allosalinactinospora lopnorensis]|uniref:PadR family transcriptional regulator n=1 Tax=Allosalinactinospora lopnorensis TaxID=1352348 RepID=UPI000623D487|nr:PadR family transcriptional regulator [Allosalinactinospora lopnorensis]
MTATSVNDPGPEHDDLRAGILMLLAEGPLSGYEIINEVTERSNGRRRATSGTIYPVLDRLDDEGLVRLSEAGGGGSRQRPFELTHAGSRYVEEHAAELAPPWETPVPAPAPAAAAEEPEKPEEAQPRQIKVHAPARHLREVGAPSGEAAPRFQEVAAQFSTAADQVARVGTEQQLERARKLVAESKRGLYRILAEDDEAGEGRETGER